MKNLAQTMFDEMMLQCFSTKQLSEMPKTEYNERKMMFFAGANVMFNKLVLNMAKMNEDEQIEQIDVIHKELKAYING